MRAKQNRGRCRRCGFSHRLTAVGLVAAHSHGTNPDCPGKGIPPRLTDPTWEQRARLAEGVLKHIGEIPSHRGWVSIGAIQEAMEVLDS